MSLHLTFKHGMMVTAAIAVACTAIAWSGSGNRRQKVYTDVQDTVPVTPKYNFHNRHIEKAIDDEIEQLEQSLEKLDKSMENAGWEKMEAQLEMDMNKFEREMESHQTDVEDIDENIQEALNNTDFEKIRKETADAVQQGRENIDFKEIQANIRRSLAEAQDNLSSMQAARQESIDKIKDRIKRARIEIEKNRPEINAEMERARKEIADNKEWFADFREMLVDMKHAGIVDTDKDFRIEYRDGSLFINNKIQSAEVLDKYKKYFDDNDFSISQKDGRLNVDMN